MEWRTNNKFCIKLWKSTIEMYEMNNVRMVTMLWVVRENFSCFQGFKLEVIRPNSIFESKWGKCSACASVDDIRPPNNVLLWFLKWMRHVRSDLLESENRRSRTGSMTFCILALLFLLMYFFLLPLYHQYVQAQTSQTDDVSFNPD